MFNISIPLFIATVIVVFFGMGLHEYGHALMANYWGDPTPRRNGKLTPNPMAHINPAGWAFYLIMALGIVGQSNILLLLLIIIMIMVSQSRGAIGAFSLGYVAVNPHLMRNPRWGNFWTSFAGPLANLGQAIVAAMILRLISNPLQAYSLLVAPSMISSPQDFVLVLLAVAVTVNITLFVFSIIPLAPLDGWHMMFSLLPGTFLARDQVPLAIRKNAHGLAQFLQTPASKWREWFQLSSYIFMGLFLLGLALPQLDILGRIINPPSTMLLRLLLGF